MRYRITIVGAGNVGRALGVNLMTLGNEVTYAVRSPDPERVPEGASVVPIQGAASNADLVILAIPFSTVRDVVPSLGLTRRSVVIDATNPFGQPVPDGFPSGAAFVALLTDGAPVVKAFNVLGAEHMSDPGLKDGFRPLLPVAGDDDAARVLVAVLATDMGFDAVEVGGIEAASTVEAAAVYWGLVAMRGGRGRQTVLVAHQRTVP
jgi:predicted dinucleotide-binding enzyme